MKRYGQRLAADLDTYDADKKLLHYEDELAEDPVFKSLVAAVDSNGSTRFTNRIFHDLTVAIHARGMNKLTKPQAKKVVSEVRCGSWTRPASIRSKQQELSPHNRSVSLALR